MQDYYRVPKYQAGKVIGRFIQKAKPSKEAIDAVTNFIKDIVEAAGYTMPEATSAVKNVTTRTAHSGYTKEAVDKIANQTFRKPTEIVNNINYTRPSSFELQQYITDIADQTPQTKAVVEQATSKLPYVKPALAEPTYSQAKAMEQEMTKKIAKKAKKKAARRKAKELAQKAKEQEPPVTEETPPVTEETPQKKSIGQKAKELVQKVKGTASKTADETKEEVTKKTNFFKKHPYATVAAGLALSNGTSREGIGNFLNWWTTSPSKQNQTPVPGPVKDTTTVDATIQNAVDAVNQKQQPAQKDSSFRSNQDYNDLFDDEQWLQ